MSKPSSILTKLVESDRRDTFLNQFQGNKLLFKTLQKALKEKYETSLTNCEKVEVHSYSNSATFLADQHGYRRAIKELTSLLPKEE